MSWHAHIFQSSPVARGGRSHCKLRPGWLPTQALTAVDTTDESVILFYSFLLAQSMLEGFVSVCLQSPLAESRKSNFTDIITAGQLKSLSWYHKAGEAGQEGAQTLLSAASSRRCEELTDLLTQPLIISSLRCGAFVVPRCARSLEFSLWWSNLTLRIFAHVETIIQAIVKRDQGLSTHTRRAAVNIQLLLFWQNVFADPLIHICSLAGTKCSI